MCKIGILAIGADLCHSAYDHVQTLSSVVHRQVQRDGTSDDDDYYYGGIGVVHAVLITMDLAFHIAALITHVLGRGRQKASRGDHVRGAPLQVAAV